MSYMAVGSRQIHFSDAQVPATHLSSPREISSVSDNRPPAIDQNPPAEAVPQSRDPAPPPPAAIEEGRGLNADYYA